MSSLPPFSVIAQWPAANYINPETRGPSLLVVNTVFMIVTTLIILLRLYTRLAVVRFFGADDVLILLSWMITIGIHAILYLAFTKYGWDRHVWDIPFTWAVPSLKLAYAAALLFAFPSCLIAGSLLVFYYRLTRETTLRWFRSLIILLSIVNMAEAIVFFFVFLFRCLPISASWALIPPSTARCVDDGMINTIVGIIKTISDVAVVTLPIPLVLRMQMSRRQKYGLVVLFAFGYTAAAAGAVKTYFIWKAYYDDPLFDIPWVEYLGSTAAVIENDLGIICACIPTIRPLWHPIIASARRFSSSYASQLKAASAVSTSQACNSGAGKYFKSPASKTYKNIESSNVELVSRQLEPALVIQKREIVEIIETPCGESGV